MKRNQIEFRRFNYTLGEMEYSSEMAGGLEQFFSNDCCDELSDEYLFTGAIDRNKVKIFEGDILSVMVNELTKIPPKTGLVSLDSYTPIKGERFFTGKKIPSLWTVEYVDHLTYSGFKVYGINRRFNKPLTKSVIFNNDVKVIGNIHQNKELLGTSK